MDFNTQLVVGIGALWTVLSTFVGGSLKWLLDDRKVMKEEFAREKAAYEAKLEAASLVIIRQNDSMQKQIDAQQQMISALQLMGGQKS
jgi:hypothetical protein